MQMNKREFEIVKNVIVLINKITALIKYYIILNKLTENNHFKFVHRKNVFVNEIEFIKFDIKFLCSFFFFFFF